MVLMIFHFIIICFMESQQREKPEFYLFYLQRKSMRHHLNGLLKKSTSTENLILAHWPEPPKFRSCMQLSGRRFLCLNWFRRIVKDLAYKLNVKASKIPRILIKTNRERELKVRRFILLLICNPNSNLADFP